MKRLLAISTLLILTACATPVTITPIPSATTAPTSTLVELPINLPHELYLPFIDYEGRLVFSSDISCPGGQCLYWVDADGSNLTQITFGDDHAPDWSPDGRQIVFTRRLSLTGQNDIYLLDVATLEVSQITDTPADEGSASWSPTGEYIAYSYHSTGETTDNYDIYVMKLDGRITKRLTTADSEDYSSSWSPDGSKILFSRDGVLHTIDTTCLDEPDTCEANIARVPILSDVVFERAWQGEWSPTGDRIVFSASIVDQQQHLFVMNADGSGLRQLTGTSSNGGGGPAWSPDGRYITYSSGEGPPPYDLLIMDVGCLDLTDGCDEFQSYLLVDDGSAPFGSFGSSWEPIH